MKKLQIKIYKLLRKLFGVHFAATVMGFYYTDNTMGADKNTIDFGELKKLLQDKE